MSQTNNEEKPIESTALFGLRVYGLQRRYGMNYIQASKLHADLESIAAVGRDSVEALLERFRTGEPTMKCVRAVSDLSEIFSLPNVESFYA